MPHGRPTPLGRQLHSALARFTAPLTPPPPPYRCSTAPISPLPTRSYHHTNVAFAAAVAPLPHEQLLQLEPPRSAVAFNDRHLNAEPRPSARILRRRARIDHLTLSLRNIGKDRSIFKRPHHKLDLTYVHVRDRQGVGKARINRQRHKGNPVVHDEVSLQSILGSYLSSSYARHDPLLAEWETQYVPSSREAQLLHQQGYSMEDVVAWAEIASTDDTLKAAEKLAERIIENGPLAVPMFMFLHLLKRTSISVRALKALLHCSHLLLGGRVATIANPGIDQHARFLTCVRLVRHAREIWPAALSSIIGSFLDTLQHSPVLNSAQNVLVTYQLNTLISLLSLSTAQRPFKDVEYQEKAIINILRYMSEHDPPLQIDRRGYRGVIRIQLTQKKTTSERQWAELKSLSWPPWKVDRTAMDALFTADEHGMSRAAQTLSRMREAGYAPLHWEKLAQIYTGWDVDQTPTIQTRILFGQPGFRLSPRRPERLLDSARWAARITSTRTTQEAWACYLAWEDKGFRGDPDVYLAIAIKLREEEVRQEVNSKQQKILDSNDSELPRPYLPLGILPGDSRHVWPLPPSTHLETYTRTSPPTLEGFYEHLSQQNIKVHCRLLAFMIKHARSLSVGLQLLHRNLERFPPITSLYSADLSGTLLNLPDSIFDAVVILYSRFEGGPSVHSYALTAVGPKTSVQLTANAGITHAIQLLQRRPGASIQVWSELYAAMCRDTRIKNLSLLTVAYATESGTGHQSSDVPNGLKRADGSIKAYRLTSLLLEIQQQHRIGIDPSSFRFLCRSTENLAIATWQIFQAIPVEHTFASQSMGPGMTGLLERASSPHGSRSIMHDVWTLKELFWNLVGSKRTSHTGDTATGSALHISAATLPRLLAVPPPAMLHSYVRALGWFADHKGLLELVQWMNEYHAEIIDASAQDRNGPTMVRNTVIALRVFLERTWLDLSPGKYKAVAIGATDWDVSQDDTADGKPGVPVEGRIEERIEAFRSRADQEILDAVKDIVEGAEEWGGWPTDEETEKYASDKRFWPFSMGPALTQADDAFVHAT